MLQVHEEAFGEWENRFDVSNPAALGQFIARPTSQKLRMAEYFSV